MKNLPHIQPYAHVFFCADMLTEEEGTQRSIVGQYHSKIFVGPACPWPLPQLVMGVELVVDHRDSLRSVAFSFSRNGEVLAQGNLDHQLPSLMAGSRERDPASTRYSMRGDLRISDVELYAGDTLTGTVLLNGELLNYITLRVEATLNPGDEERSARNVTESFRIRRDPAIPVLVLVPGTGVDSRAIAGIAAAYAHAGLLVSAHGKRGGRPEFLFPAIVCSSFAIELFLKYFVVLSQRQADESLMRYPTGHKLMGLWRLIDPENQRIIAGLFRNSSSKPLMTSPDLRIQLFEDALLGIGESPFVKWRYAYELDSPSMLSHVAVTEVLNALGHGAQYVMGVNGGKCEN